MGPKPAPARSLIYSIALSKGRMEALTDGIFAIAMTLLVLELKVPDMPKSTGSAELLHRLGEGTPAFFSFLVSFLYCGLLWMMHHLAMHFIRHLKLALVWLNLLFLMSVSLVPFSCALLGHFMRSLVAQEIYFANLFVCAVLLYAQWVVAHQKGLISQDDPLAAAVMGRRLMAFPLALVAGMGATLYRPTAGFYAVAIVLLGLRAWQRRVTSPAAKPSSS
jgi:TMEM175 potassium channel family protein